MFAVGWGLRCRITWEVPLVEASKLCKCLSSGGFSEPCQAVCKTNFVKNARFGSIITCHQKKGSASEIMIGWMFFTVWKPGAMLRVFKWENGMRFTWRNAGSQHSTSFSYASKCTVAEGRLCCSGTVPFFFYLRCGQVTYSQKKLCATLVVFLFFWKNLEP